MIATVIGNFGRLSQTNHAHLRASSPRVIDQVQAKKGPRPTANVSVWEALGYVLAQEVKTDREYPPFNRSTRDGYAVRASEAAMGANFAARGKSKLATPYPSR